MIRVDESDPVGELEPSFPYRDVTIRRGVQFKDQYDIQSEIGRGKFGTVYRCKEKSNGLTLAAKVVNTGRKEDRRAVEREVEIMRRLQHPRLIQLYDAIDTGTSVYVILELIEGGELFERVIGDDFVLTERSCAVFMRQICEGIEFVHSQNILHLDMKPENILCLTKEGNRIKIIDFGLARKYDPEKKLQVLFGTPEFVAPEVVNFDQIGFGTDMWSIGVICYVLLSGLSPFMGDTDIETMANVTIAKYDFDDEAFAEISSEAKDFIRSLLVKDKGGRATAAQCREHAWLKRKNPPAPRTKIGAKSEVENSSTHRANTHNGTKEELEVSKDNLRLFVERWREHPDSPYGVTNFIFECEPVRETGEVESGEGFLESISTRGQSPSPCGSLTSSVDSVNTAVANDNYSLTIPGGRGPFERRASEGTAAGHEKHRDPAVQIVLAEEIIKLSEHLRAIAAAPRNASEETSTPSETAKSISEPQQPSAQPNRSDTMQQLKNSPPKNPQPTSTINKKSNTIIRDTASFGKSIGLRLEKQSSIGKAPEADPVQVNEISDKLSRITNQRKTNGTAFGGVSRFTSTNSEFSTTTSFGPRKTRRLVDLNTSSTSSNDSVHQRSGSLFSRSMSSSTSEYKSSNSRLSSRMESGENESSHREESLQQESTSGHLRVSEPIAINSQDSTKKHIDLTPPWRRTKLHRFTETCRDVPRISNLQDIHRGLNFDEPTSTKNLLLQLLGEWDDVHTGTRPNGIGRKSVSLDWCGEESVARRSMSSLAEYFQSEQQKPPPGEPTPSVHR